MFYPIVVVVQANADDQAEEYAAWLAGVLAERFEDDEFGLALYGGEATVPEVQFGYPVEDSVAEGQERFEFILDDDHEFENEETAERLLEAIRDGSITDVDWEVQ